MGLTRSRPLALMLGMLMVELISHPGAALGASESEGELTPGTRIVDEDRRFSFVVPESGYQLYRWRTDGGGIEVRLKPHHELLTMGNGDYIVRVYSGDEVPPPGFSLNQVFDSVLDTIAAAFGIEIRVLRRRSRIFQGHNTLYAEWLGLGKYEQVAEGITEARRTYQYASELFYHEADLYSIVRSNPVPILYDPANPAAEDSGGVEDRTRDELERFLREFRFEMDDSPIDQENRGK